MRHCFSQVQDRQQMQSSCSDRGVAHGQHSQTSSAGASHSVLLGTQPAGQLCPEQDSCSGGPHLHQPIDLMQHAEQAAAQHRNNPRVRKSLEESQTLHDAAGRSGHNGAAISLTADIAFRKQANHRFQPCNSPGQSPDRQSQSSSSRMPRSVRLWMQWRENSSQPGSPSACNSQQQQHQGFIAAAAVAAPACTPDRMKTDLYGLASTQPVPESGCNSRPLNVSAQGTCCDAQSLQDISNRAVLDSRCSRAQHTQHDAKESIQSSRSSRTHVRCPDTAGMGESGTRASSQLDTSASFSALPSDDEASDSISLASRPSSASQISANANQRHCGSSRNASVRHAYSNPQLSASSEVIRGKVPHWDGKAKQNVRRRLVKQVPSEKVPFR